MATLHNTIENTKLFAKWFAITVGSVIFVVLLFRIGLSIKEKLYPTPAPPPTADFGKVPQIPFPNNAITNRFNFIINTPSGTLPQDIPDRTYIYEITQKAAGLLSLDQIKGLVTSTEFQNINPVALNDTDYSWAIQQTPYKRITFNIVTQDFNLLSQYQADPTVIAAQTLPDQPTAITTAVNFLTGLQSYPTDIDENKTVAAYYAITNGTLVPASSASNAQVIRIDFYQKDKGDANNSIPLVYPHPPQSTINVLIAAGPTTPQIVEAHYAGREITDQKGQYAIKTPKEAFTELQNGGGYIAASDTTATNGTSLSGSSTDIKIIDVHLAYFMADTKQKYLMPIYVFTGDSGFIGYVSAIRDEWIDTSLGQ